MKEAFDSRVESSDERGEKEDDKEGVRGQGESGEEKRRKREVTIPDKVDC